MQTNCICFPDYTWKPCDLMLHVPPKFHKMAIHFLFPGHVLARISKQPKMSRFCLFFPIDVLSTVLIRHMYMYLHHLQIPPSDSVILYNSCKLLFNHYLQHAQKQNQNPDILGDLEIQARICSKHQYSLLNIASISLQHTNCAVQASLMCRSRFFLFVGNLGMLHWTS